MTEKEEAKVCQHFTLKQKQCSLSKALVPLRQIRLQFALQQKAIMNGYNAAGHIVNCNNVSIIGNIIEHEPKKSCCLATAAHDHTSSWAHM